jgi:chromate transporter
MEALSICQIVPGSTGVTLAWFLWFKFYWVLGAMLISFAFVLPPLIFIVVLAYFYFQYWQLDFIKAIMQWLGALVVALIFNAIFQIWWWVFKKISIKDYKWYLIVIFAFLVSFLFKQVNTIFVILASWILWFLFYYFTWEFENEWIKKWDEKIESAPHIWKKIHDYYLLFWLAFIIIWILLFPITRQLFWQFFMVWAFWFWWGFTVIPVIQHNIVDVVHWLNLAEFRDWIALGQITPWSFFISAWFIGYKVYWIIWAIVATIGIFLPSIVIVTSLSKVHTTIKELRSVRIIMKGFLSWFLGIIASTVITFWKASLVDYKTWLIFILVFIWIRLFKQNSIWVILATIIVSLFIF